MRRLPQRTAEEAANDNLSCRVALLCQAVECAHAYGDLDRQLIIDGKWPEDWWGDVGRAYARALEAYDECHALGLIF